MRSALEIIDEDGLDTFSLEKLSRRLGVKGPSLYYHFKDKADVLASVARTILLEVPTLLRDHSLPWDQQLMRMTAEFRRALLRHPRALPLLLTYSPRQVVPDAYEIAVRGLSEEGVPERFHLLLLDGLDKIVLGASLSHAAEGNPTLGFEPLDADVHPHLVRAFEASRPDPDELFTAACRTYIDGVQQLMDQAASPG